MARPTFHPSDRDWQELEILSDRRRFTPEIDPCRIAVWPSTRTGTGAMERVVFDTSVLVAAARSRNGASFALVTSIPSTRFQICLSVGLYAEWQDVLTREENLPPGQTADDALAFLRYLASQAWLQDIFFLWRPFLSDPDDDMILELAFAASCRYIVTHNVRDFRGCERLGIEAITPRDFLRVVRTSSNP